MFFSFSGCEEILLSESRPYLPELFTALTLARISISWAGYQLTGVNLRKKERQSCWESWKAISGGRERDLQQQRPDLQRPPPVPPENVQPHSREGKHKHRIAWASAGAARPPREYPDNPAPPSAIDRRGTSRWLVQRKLPSCVLPKNPLCIPATPNSTRPMTKPPTSNQYGVWLNRCRVWCGR